MWLVEAVVGAGWWGGEGSRTEREIERVVLTLGLQVMRGRRPGNSYIPSLPQLNILYGLGHWGLMIP